MNIAVIGTGYVGLVSGVCLAETGNNVICVDIDENKVNSLQQGIVPIYEPKLDHYMERNAKAGRLHFTTNLAEAVEKSDILFLALPTPDGGDGAADLKYVLGVANQLGRLITSYKIVINKSTVPVGTGDKVYAAIAANCKVEFDVISNPEFLREGWAVDDFMKPDRVVIGSSSERASNTMAELYRPYVERDNQLVFMDIRSAELTKYAANSFLAAKITFMNEVARLCELVDADVDMVRLGIGADERIGSRFLFPGIGYGGSCFPKDVKALIKSAEEVGYNFEMLKAVDEVNNAQKTILLPKIKTYFNNNLQGKHIAIWGLAFKPNTDDMRDAPSVEIIKALLAEGCTVTAYDPEAIPNTQRILGDSITYAPDQYTALTNADALVICTEWPAFTTPDFSQLKTLLHNPAIFDGRNIFNLAKMHDKGFYYCSIGRKTLS